MCCPGCDSALVSVSISLSVGRLLPFAIALVLLVYQPACKLLVLSTAIPVYSTVIPVYQYAQVRAPPDPTSSRKQLGGHRPTGWSGSVAGRASGALCAPPRSGGNVGARLSGVVLGFRWVLCLSVPLKGACVAWLTALDYRL